MLDELDPGKQPAVRAALDPEPARAGDLVRDQVLRDGCEIVIDKLPVNAEPGFVPLGAELPAAADVRENIDTALLQPQLAVRRGIGRRL